MQVGDITKDFFIRPEVTNFLVDGHDKTMYEQFMGDKRGTRWDDPLYYIQNALSLVGDQERLAVEASAYNADLEEPDYDQAYKAGYSHY